MGSLVNFNSVKEEVKRLTISEKEKKKYHALCGRV
jgi:hypothetical protein